MGIVILLVLVAWFTVFFARQAIKAGKALKQGFKGDGK
jgi:hypothetical protein